MPQFSTPPADSPTVELAVGGRYLSHHRQTVYEVVSASPDGRFVVRNSDNGHEDVYRANGRINTSTTTWSDLVERVA